MTEARDIDEIVGTLEVLADWSALDGCKREVLALIGDWRAKKVALLAIAAIENKDWGPDWEEIEEARTIANQALGLNPPPPPQSMASPDDSQDGQA